MSDPKRIVYTNMRSALPRPGLTDHPVDVGHRSEAAVLAELVKRGYRLFLPFGVGEVDLFAVYCPDNDKVYVIPAEEVPPTGMYLRVNPSRNRQRKGVRWARDYELPA